jgi:hypothetical protein
MVGFTNSKDRERIERFLGRMKRGGFLPATALIAMEMADMADDRLFNQSIINQFRLFTTSS